MEITLQYFDGCPNWETTRDHLHTLVDEGFDIAVRYEQIDSHERAEERGFHGSPTVLIDGVDPFVENDAPEALACRIYQTDAGPAGSPSISQLRQVLAEAD